MGSPLSFYLQLLPLAALAARSVTRLEVDRRQQEQARQGFTLDYYRELFVNKQQSYFLCTTCQSRIEFAVYMPELPWLYRFQQLLFFHML